MRYDLAGKPQFPDDGVDFGAVIAWKLSAAAQGI